MNGSIEKERLQCHARTSLKKLHLKWNELIKPIQHIKEKNIEKNSDLMFCSTKQRTGGGGGYYAVNSWAAVTLLKNEVKLAVQLLKVSYFLNVDAHSQVRKHTRFTYITHALSSNSAWVESVTNTVSSSSGAAWKSEWWEERCSNPRPS